MKIARIALLVFLGSLLFSGKVKAQDFAKDFAKDHKLNLNQDGSQYFKITGMIQTWGRYMDYNPGSTVFGYPKSSGFDVGIRRYRIQMYGKVTDRVFIYGQIGENNFNSISDRKLGFFVHDAYGEYAIDKTKLSMGAGLTGWCGLTRFSNSATSSIMGLDVPAALETTNDVTDQFTRKLSIYAKGKLEKFDYRIAVSQPMAIQKSTSFVPTASSYSNFSAYPPNAQWSGYFMYQFKDQESNEMPWGTGTYLGKKTVFNLGAGFIYQKDAMWRLQNAADPNSIIKGDMAHFAGDIYYDAPVGAKGEAISAYATFTHYGFGQGYLRMTAPMNPANGSTNTSVLNGGGNAFPAYGNGNLIYAQFGYKLKDNLIGKTTLMPYVSMQHANYDRLNTAMNYYDLGVNWLLAGHASKLTLAYQNRPIYDTNGDLTTHKSAIVMQYQVNF